MPQDPQGELQEQKAPRAQVLNNEFMNPPPFPEH